MPRVNIGIADELRERQLTRFEWSGQQYVVVCHEERLFLLDNLCPHKGAALCDGDIVNNTIQCPWHKARFDLQTGRGLTPLAGQGVTSYPLIEEQGQLFAELP
jgi:nitrite reductase/ring-hydroxylating ferredoxin subunit